MFSKSNYLNLIENKYLELGIIFKISYANSIKDYLPTIHRKDIPFECPVLSTCSAMELHLSRFKVH